MGEADPIQRLRQCRLTGGVLPQAILSFIPVANGPHAAVCASRAASGSEAAEAIALVCLPPKATVTEHSTRWDESVDQSRNAAKASNPSSDRNFIRAVMLPPVGVRQPASGP
jgi:hypothetical protein